MFFLDKKLIHIIITKKRSDNVLEKLITDKTNIIYLEDKNITKDEYKSIICESISFSRKKDYLKMIKKYNNQIYIFKEKGMNYYGLINELIGSFLAKKINLDTVSYDICKCDGKLGIASKNFKDEKYDYKYLNDLTIIKPYIFALSNINNIKEECITQENKDSIINQILKLICLDLYMCQRDRNMSNIQFKIDKDTNYLSLAPIYDYYDCLDNLSVLYNAIISLSDDSIRMLLNNYSNFSDILKETISIPMTQLIDEIACYYGFNKDNFIYQNLIDYYEIKQEKQKNYLKRYTK